MPQCNCPIPREPGDWHADGCTLRTDYSNADSWDSRTWPHCRDCGLRHSSPASCRFPGFRARFGELTDEQDRFLRWMAGWDQWTADRFMEILELQHQAGRDSAWATITGEG